MNLKELRQWFFEAIGILFPGAIGILLAIAFAGEPAAFGANRATIERVVQTIQGFSSAGLSIALLVGLAYAMGHLIQQMSVYLLRTIVRVWRPHRKSFIDGIFGSDPIKDYLVPPQSKFTDRAHLSQSDYFMMIYPDIARRTKRETFISISAFCGAMAWVSLACVVLLGVARVAQIWSNTHMPTGELAICVGMGLLLAVVWIDRCIFFHDLADRIVVNYFLFKFGNHFRKSARNRSVK